MIEAQLTLKEAARALNVTESRCADLARRGIIPVVRLGRHYRVDPGKLREFIESGGKALPGGWRQAEAR